MTIQSTIISNQIFNDVSMQILSDLFHSEKALSIYELSSGFSYRQYQYMLKKLESNLLVVSYRNRKRIYYRLNIFYKELVETMLEIGKWELKKDYQSLSKSLLYDKAFLRVISALRKVDGWAFTSTTALLIWVPFLDLQLPYFSVCVRDRHLKNRLEENFPSSVLRVQFQAKYFSHKQSVTVLNGLPVLKPELMFLPLLNHENKTVRVSSLLLLPFLSPKKLLRDLNRNKKMFPTIMYSLLAIKKLLRMNTPSSIFLSQWFFNLDCFDSNIFLKHYLRNLGRVGLKKYKPTTFNRFELLRIKHQQNTKQWNEWDRLAMLFPKRSVKIEPKTITELTLTPLSL